jgi:hypothetical protein
VPNSNYSDRSRRSFLTLVATAASATFLGLRPGSASAADRVSPTDVLAQSLGYTEDGTKVDKSKFPTYKAGQKCGNCRFFTGTAGQPYGPCQIFAGKEVNTNGWCVSFNAKT